MNKQEKVLYEDAPHIYASLIRFCIYFLVQNPFKNLFKVSVNPFLIHSFMNVDIWRHVGLKCNRSVHVFGGIFGCSQVCLCECLELDQSTSSCFCVGGTRGRLEAAPPVRRLLHGPAQVKQMDLQCMCRHVSACVCVCVRGGGGVVVRLPWITSERWVLLWSSFVFVF